MPTRNSQDTGIVDLVAIGEAAQPLAIWWRRLLDLGQPGLQRLDQARQALTALGPIPGRLGRAIDLIVACDTATPDTEMAAAIAMLVELADRVQPPSPDTAPDAASEPAAPAPTRRQPAASAAGEQMSLPLDQQSAS